MKQQSDYITLESFLGVQDQRLSFLFGSTLWNVTNLQFNIHKINSGTKPHIHPDFQVIYYFKGTGTQTIGNKRYDIVPQSVVFIPPHKVHSFQPSVGNIVEAFTLRFTFIWNLGEKKREIEKDKDITEIIRILYTKNPKCIKLNFQEAEKVDEIIQKITEELNLKEFGHSLALRGYILLILRYFLLGGIKKGEGTKLLSRTQIVFLKADSFITQNVGKVLTLSEVADYCCISPSYLQKIFKQFLGRSFLRYTAETKVEYVKNLLKTTSLSIKTIAGRCGIFDSNYFTRLFKKIEGCSPTEFRSR
ncbi:MAG: AraC family transcriptional regulator [Candidatus Omnitrophota bacterium]